MQEQGSGKKVSAGHVSMMNDVLISNLPEDQMLAVLGRMLEESEVRRLFKVYVRESVSSSTPASIEDSNSEDVLRLLPLDQLRIIVRRLLGASHDIAALFVSSVRNILAAQPLPAAPTTPGPPPYTELRKLVARAKVYVAAHQNTSALTVFAMFPDSLHGAVPPLDVELRKILIEVGGDMVQGAQALKESGDKSSETQAALRNLLKALTDLKVKWTQKTDAGDFPWNRALRQLIDTGIMVFPGTGFEHLSIASTGEAGVKRVKKTSDPAAAKVEKWKLGDTEVPSIWWGLWQMSSSSWGSAGEDAVLEGMEEMVDHGLCAADMADHYGDAELIFGQFRSRYTPAEGQRPFCATKYCQFKRVPANEVIDRTWVLSKVEERARRVGGTVDLLQVHWQYLDDERYLDVFDHLVSITQDRPDLVRNIGLCNNDTKSLIAICEHLLKTQGRAGIVSNQIQYSLIDSRPRYAMEAACEKYGIKLITYGTFCGGLLSEKWLGREAPNLYGESLITSQRKYFDMIQAWGDWPLFQELLQVLQSVAQKHDVDLANVAARWVLEQPATGAVIVGTRFGTTSHVESTMKTFDVKLDEEDKRKIDAVVARGRSREMFEQIGDCGDEYR